MKDRSWMYNKNLPERKGITDEFLDGVNEFMTFALSKATGSQIRCPCLKCKNEKYDAPETVIDHLYRKGFTPDYHNWICHGEPYIEPSSSMDSSHLVQNFPMREEYNRLNPEQRMIFDTAGPNFVPYWAEKVSLDSNEAQTEDIPSSSTPTIGEPNAQPDMNADDHVGLSERFWDVLKAADEPLWGGCENETQLSAVTELLKIKTEFNLSENCFNRISQWVGRCMPRDHTFPVDYYHTKKLVRELGLPMEKIDMCPDGCMLFWKTDATLDHCKFCNHERYKRSPGKKDIPHKQLRYLPLIPRLQRLFASSTTAADMRWHDNHKPDEEGIMCHPSDSEAWKHFDENHPDFASEPRNVRLSLCADGFAPFSQSGNAYSCWPVIVTPYNFPPSMCLTTPYMFLTMVIPGPHNPKKLIDVCLQPLIDELNLLWTKGVSTFDISQEETFCMRAALLWTINDFPAYGMMSGWSTAGLMACPICMEDTKSFWLENSRKPSWFDCHRRSLEDGHLYRKNKQAFVKGRVETSPPPQRLTSNEIWDRVKDLPRMVDDPISIPDGYGSHHKWTKRSIFWDLPYWKTHLIRHNLDVMHIEKNVFDNVFNTVMDVKKKSKDSLRARKDLKQYCHRPELAVEQSHSGSIPKAVYTLTKNQQREVCKWIKTLKFPDGYASNIGRCVQLDECRLIGMKSHDCHVFMQRLIPVAFKEYLPVSVWGPLAELSQFFHALCSPTLSVARMQELDNAIPLLLCKLERIFPPSFFDSMEHLLIHLSYEAKIAGPVQYRWMYPFERFLHRLKKMISNKARVEASICSPYLIDEISTLAGQYSQRQIPSIPKRKKSEKNDSGSFKGELEQFSVFNYPGRGFGKLTTRWLNDQTEKHAIETFILLNCDETEECAKLTLFNKYTRTFSKEIGGARDSDFDTKFTHWFKSHIKDKHTENELLQSLAMGPSAQVRVWSAYVINGYTFHTEDRGQGKSTMNSGVCITSFNSEGKESQYYGILTEIVELEYTGVPAKQIVLFKCRWFHPNEIRINKKYDLIEINHKSLYRSNDPFIFASQAVQVYYASYPGAKGNRANYWAVCKTKARRTIDKRWTDIQDVAYQPDDVVQIPIIVDEDELVTGNLRDPSGEVIFVEDDDQLVNEQEPTDFGDGEFSSTSECEFVFEEEEPNERFDQD